MDYIKIVTWLAIFLLPIGYWKQVYQIHKMKEVDELNLGSYLMFTFAYMFLGIESYSIKSTMFLIKNILAIIPTVVICFQILKYRKKSKSRK